MCCFKNFVFGCFLLTSLVGWSQNNVSLNGYSNGVMFFNTYQEQMAGKTKNENIHLQFSGIQNNTNIANWYVTVRLLGNYTNQSNLSYSVAPQHTSLQFNDVNRNIMEPGNQSPVVLSNAEKVIIQGAPPLTPQNTQWYMDYAFDFIVHGGNHLLVPNGRYVAPIEFRLYDGNNVLVASHIVSNNVGFKIHSLTAGNSTTLLLQNSADNVTFQFDDMSDYYSGLSVSIPLAIKTVGYNPHEIIVKSNSSELTSSTTSHTIPVSLFRIAVNQTQENLPDLILAPPSTLSTADHVLVQNPVSNYLYHEVQYNLEYSIDPNAASGLFGTAGTYTTRLYFVVIPQ